METPQDPRLRAGAPPPQGDAPWRQRKRAKVAAADGGEAAPWRTKKKAGSGTEKLESEQWQQQVQSKVDEQLGELELTPDQVRWVAVETKSPGGAMPTHASAWLARSPTLRMAVRGYLREVCKTIPGTPTDEFGRRVVCDALVAKLEKFDRPISELLQQYNTQLERSEESVREAKTPEARHIFHRLVREASVKLPTVQVTGLDEASCAAIAERIAAQMFQDEALGPRPAKPLSDKCKDFWQESQQWILSLLPGSAAFEKRESRIMRALSVAAVEDQLREAPRWSARFVCAALPFCASAGFSLSLQVFKACAGSGAESEAVHSFVQTFLPSHPLQVEKFVDGLSDAGSSTVTLATFKTLLQHAIKNNHMHKAWKWIGVISARHNERVDHETVSAVSELERICRGQLRLGHWDIMLKLLQMTDAPPPRDLFETVVSGVDDRKASSPWNHNRSQPTLCNEVTRGNPPWLRADYGSGQFMAPPVAGAGVDQVCYAFVGDADRFTSPLSVSFTFTGKHTRGEAAQGT
mmetsp:Transcript_22576/g.49446  ORF Transcript_22576/g.49446 Transcript_22576/m.49446 type:complete len:522 (+) Transcript_22576:30-1595(+)